MSARLDRWAEMAVLGRRAGRHDARATRSDPSSARLVVDVVPELPDRRLRFGLGVPWLLRGGGDRGTVGAASFPLVAFCLVGPVLGLVAATSVSAAGNWGALSDAVGVTVVLSIGGSLLWLMGTSGVRVRGDLVFVSGLLVRTAMSAGRVQRIEWADGITVASDDGVAVGTVALGGSLLGAMTGNRRQRNVAVRLLQWVDRRRALDDALLVSPTRVRWRYAAFGWCAGWALLSIAAVLVPAILES